MNDWCEDFQERLLAADSFSAALSLFCPQDKTGVSWKKPKILSYSELSRRMGLRSRSHVREIVLGHKTAPKSFPDALCKSLKIGGPWKRYLETLYQYECEERPEKFFPDLQIQRQKIRKSYQRRVIEGPSTEAASALSNPHLPVIFASLGDEKNGATLADVIRRSKLSEEKILPCLRDLIKYQAVEQREDRFIASSPHLIFSEIGEEEYFHRDFIRASEHAKIHVRSAPKDRTLFLSSTFCVREKDVPALRAELRETLLRYIGASEFPEGDQVLQLTVSLL